MPLVSTDALVLHAFDYRETSRIIRLVTRELGVVSVIAHGARRPKNKFGPALDLFASGTAEFQAKQGRDLHVLTAFEVTCSRSGIGASLDRFAAASAMSELLLRFAPEDADSSLLDTVTGALDALLEAPMGASGAVALGGAWSVVAGLGFAPTLDVCASCHAALDPALAVTFHHRAGGALCTNCARQAPGARTLPPDARDAMRQWLARESSPPLDDATLRAHQRLLREFLEEHLADDCPLRALVAWERHEIDA